MDIESKVELFLWQLKQNTDTNNVIISSRRDDKVDKLLRKFGWTRKILFDYLVKNLNASDYSSGPLEEHGNPDGSVWIFGKNIQGIDVYIKVSQLPDKSKCISFHEQERELYYPLKGGSSNE